MVADTDTVNLTEAARGMNVSRSTIYQWMGSGYEPEYGRLTTLGHLKKWFREVYQPRLAAEKKAKRFALKRELDRLR